MAIATRYGIVGSVNCVFVERRGAFESGSMVATVAAIAALPGYASGMNFYIDVASMDYTEASYAEIYPNRGKWEALAQSTGKIKIAFVDASGKNFGIGRQSEILLANDTIERKPFKSAMEALIWLGIGPDFDAASHITQRIPDGNGSR